MAQLLDWSARDAELLALRKGGASWRVIGAALGVRAAAAQLRHRKLDGGAPLRSVAGQWQPSCDMLKVRRVCAEHFGVAEADILKRSHSRKVVLARQAAAYVLRAIWPGLSYPCIARLIGYCDHSMALYSCKTMAARMERDPALAQQIGQLVRMLTARERLRDHNAHVLIWQARALDRSGADRRAARDAAERARRLVMLGVYVAGGDAVFMEAVAREVAAVSATRKVKPVNELVGDDADALRRKNGSDGLSRAIAAAGGWR